VPNADGSQPVTVYPSNDLPPVLQGAIEGGGGVAFTSFQLNQPLNATFFLSADMGFDGSVNSNALMVNTLHEIGHSLGLGHSRSASSVMFPYTTVCNVLSTGYVPQADVLWPVQEYDPKPSPSPTHGGGGCQISKPYFPPADIGSVKPTHSSMYFRGRGIEVLGSPEQRSVYSGDHSLVSIHVDPQSSVSAISPQSLYLASTLVVEGRVLGIHRNQSRGLLEVDESRIRIERIYRHDSDNLSGARVGNSIEVLDGQPRRTHYFVDDPPLTPGTHVLVFLKRFVAPDGVTTRYLTTYPMVSKFGIDTNRLLFSQAPIGSLVSNTLNGSSLEDLGTILAPHLQFQRGQFDEERAVHSLLSQRGVVTATDLRRYRAWLASGKNSLADDFAKFDQSQIAPQGRC